MDWALCNIKAMLLVLCVVLKKKISYLFEIRSEAFVAIMISILGF